jgi:hypothetical protein
LNFGFAPPFFPISKEKKRSRLDKEARKEFSFRSITKNVWFPKTSNILGAINIKSWRHFLLAYLLTFYIVPSWFSHKFYLKNVVENEKNCTWKRELYSTRNFS